MAAKITLENLISQIEHMCQCAQLAEEEGYDDEVILAAFFHDIGHLCENAIPFQSMDGYGTIDHEMIGADYLLKKGFSPRVAKLVTSHVAAKRYLTFRYPDYYFKLSDASKKTLQFQGGVMTEDEARSFESDILFPIYIKLRQWDEAAKREQVALPSLDIYREKMISHLQNTTVSI
jgi:putative nucleotidyltransferase with HDIG domain